MLLPSIPPMHPQTALSHATLTASPLHFLCHQLSRGHVDLPAGIHLALHDINLANHCKRRGSSTASWHNNVQCSSAASRRVAAHHNHLQPLVLLPFCHLPV